MDLFAKGVSTYDAAAVATPGPLSATYSNGTLGAGATLTAAAPGALVIDGVSVGTASRVLVKNQSSSIENGVYVVTNPGNVSTAWVLMRASDYDNTAVKKVSAGDFLFISQGTLYDSTGWTQVNEGTGPNSEIVIGTDPIDFT